LCELKTHWQHLAADVLEHPDADQLVESAGHFAVILILDAATVLQTGLAYALLGQLDLLTAQRNTQGVDAVLLRSLHHQPAPADAEQSVVLQKT
jgi:hypothetical protein